MAALRDFAEVLTAVMAEVPVEETDLLRRLEHVRESVAYTAPEVRWALLGPKVVTAFEEHIGQSVGEGWQANVVAAWLGTP